MRVTTADMQLLGRFALRPLGRPELIIGSKKQRALLAVLASQPEGVVDRDVLANLLWGDGTNESARHNLRQTVLALRKTLVSAGLEILGGNRSSVRLNLDQLRVDLLVLKAMLARSPIEIDTTIVDAYQHPLLEDLTGVTGEFETWRQNLQSRLRADFWKIVSAASVANTIAADLQILAAGKLIAGDPYDEGVQRIYFSSLALQRGPATALGAAQTFVRQLKSDLGSEPAPATELLIAEITRQAHERPTERAVLLPDLTHSAFEHFPARDLNFTGRNVELARLHALVAGQSRREPVAVLGLAGIGKTTLVAEYAHTHKDDFHGVWWARAAQRSLLIESLASLAARLDAKFARETDREKAAIAGLTRIASLPKPLLLIYDNVEGPAAIADLLPWSGAHVIITSRWPDWTGRAHELKLDVFEADAATEFLLRRSGRRDPSGARRLVDALGRLPLAIDHAGAFCKLTTMRFDEYRMRIDSSLSRSPQGVNYPSSISATFGLAIESAGTQHPAAIPLLGWFSYLAPERIPISILAGCEVGDEDRAEGLAALYGVSLIEPEEAGNGTSTITLHRLVQSAMRAQLEAQGRAEMVAREVTRLLARAFPDTAVTEPNVWPQCASLLRHVLALRERSPRTLVPDETAAVLFQNVGSYLQVRGAYRDAEQFYREALAITERNHGADSMKYMHRQTSLAGLLSTVGRYLEAEPLLRQAIRTGEAALGRDHIDVAARIAALARLFSDTKRYSDAEPLYREAIRVVDQHLGSHATFAVAWRNNLGILLNETGRNPDGERLYREALSIAEARLGAAHFETARCHNNLGRLLRDTERYADAERHIRTALAVWHSTFGPDHAIYGRGQENLGHVVFKLGRLDEALMIAEAALNVEFTALGSHHFWTQEAARTQAAILSALGRTREADEVRTRYEP